MSSYNGCVKAGGPTRQPAVSSMRCDNARYVWHSTSVDQFTLMSDNVKKVDDRRLNAHVGPTAAVACYHEIAIKSVSGQTRPTVMANSRHTASTGVRQVSAVSERPMTANAQQWKRHARSMDSAMQ